MSASALRHGLLGVLGAVACLGLGSGRAAEPALGSLPATFLGTLSCPDCMGIRVQINLLPDGAYTLRRTWLREGHDDSVYEIGTWVLSTDGTLTLNGGGEARTLWSVVDPQTLRKFDPDRRESLSRLPVDLARCGMVLPMEPRVRLRGLFRKMPEGARFSDCLSGLQWPVAREGDYALLEAAYLRQPKKKASVDLLVTLEGRVDMTPAITTNREPMLVVEKFVRAFPGAICMERPTQPQLANRRWRPVVVRGMAVVVEPQREPWIELDARRGRFSGSAGCNHVSGSYRDESGGRLRFGAIVTTRRACPAMDLERGFLDALARARRYRFEGETLELLAEDGALLARLEARQVD